MNPRHLDPRRVRASIISLIVALALFAMKALAFRITHSTSIYSDALESIVNIMASSFLVFTLFFSSRPADAGHPYGHGKIEFLSAAIEGAMIGFAAMVILFEVAQSMMRAEPLTDISSGVWLTAAAGIGNYLLGLFLVRQGRKFGSEALVADGQHVKADFYTSVGVCGGLALVTVTGLEILDKIVALIFAFVLLFQSYRIVRKAIGGLLDEKSIPLLQNIVDAFNAERTQPIIAIHHARVMRSGGYLHVDAHVALPEFWDVQTAHRELEGFEARLERHLKDTAEFHFHLDPCLRGYCESCPLSPCPIRKTSYKTREPLSVDEILLTDAEVKAYAGVEPGT